MINICKMYYRYWNERHLIEQYKAEIEAHEALLVAINTVIEQLEILQRLIDRAE